MGDSFHRSRCRGLLVHFEGTRLYWLLLFLTWNKNWGHKVISQDRGRVSKMWKTRRELLCLEGRGIVCPGQLGLLSSSEGPLKTCSLKLKVNFEGKGASVHEEDQCFREIWEEKKKAKHLSGGGLVAKSCLTLATPWSVAHQAPLSMGFSKQEYWSGLSLPSLGDLPNPGIKPGSPALQADF